MCWSAWKKFRSVDRPDSLAQLALTRVRPSDESCKRYYNRSPTIERNSYAESIALRCLALD